MESVWWVFGQLYQKGLVYRGFKVMPFSTALSTPLSNFEANQEFADIQDPWVIVNFPVKGAATPTFFVAWTTTPWTLPSNLALCVHPTLEYCEVKDIEKGCNYYVMKTRVCGSGCLFSDKDKAAGKFEVLKSFPGGELVGKKYEPLFDFFYAEMGEQAFRVVSDEYVTDSDGVGIVHQAPAFGEDDYRVCVREGIVTVQRVPCPVDDSGNFTDEVPPFKGQYFKDADKGIMKDLRARGRIVNSGTLVHRDAFCWRSGTRLMRKTVDSWFVSVTSIKEGLLKSNNATHWVPNFVKEGRFHNWLKDARDWNISRNRYWGTPIPLWVSEDYEEIVCISSIAELEELSGVAGITDLHRESIDHITIPSKQGKGDLRRIKQVFDCWFESGSMPYASRHYPFEQKERFEQTFPANFIAEGIDQTRGWFYTLTVLGTALFGKSPFQNLIVNGLVLAEDGQKMSKSKKNYPPPEGVIDKFGSDALRCYLINSPVVRADNLKFSERGVQETTAKLFRPWKNACEFFKLACADYEAAEGKPFVFDDTKICPTTNITDKWILAFAQDLAKFVHQEMKAYRLYTVVPRVFGFVDQLTNWYIRFNRKRLRGSDKNASAEAKQEAFHSMWTLGEVLYVQSRLMSPFAPFFSEYSYQQMKQHIKSAAESEHEALSWAPADVGKWLDSMGMGQYKPLFEENNLTGQDLADLNNDDLASMGVAKCHDRKDIIRNVSKLEIPSQKYDADTLPSEYKSIHFQMLPEPNMGYADEDIVRSFEVLKTVVECGRKIRDKAVKATKIPLRELVIISLNQQKLDDALSLKDYISDELNVWKITPTKDETKYNIDLVAKPNQKLIGEKYGEKKVAISQAVAKLSRDQITEYITNGKLVVEGETLGEGEIMINYSENAASFADGKYMAKVDENDASLIVLMDVEVTEEMELEGMMREITSNTQKLRKEGKLTPQDSIKVFYSVVKDDSKKSMGAIFAKFNSNMEKILKSTVAVGAASGDVIIKSTQEIGKEGAEVSITLVKA